MARLTLKLLGYPEIHLDGQRLKFATRKAEALLIYLAVEGRTHSRDQLIVLFFPDSDPKRGRAAFRNTLARVREVVPDDYLNIDSETIGFNFAADHTLDLKTIEAALRAARLDDAAIEPLRQAAALARGDFLDGFTLSDAPDFDDWASTLREKWHQRLDTVFDQLSQRQSDTGEAANAIDTATRWIAHHRFSEAAYQRLMQLHFSAGDREAALRAYAKCTAMLRAEFNAEPSPETVALADQIRSDTPPIAARVRDAAQPLAALEAPLVGRSLQHAAVVSAFRSMQRGTQQMVVIEGEGGIGKTRLASDFCAWAAAQGATVLRGRAFEAGGRWPYQPVVEALRDRLARERDWSKLLGDVWLIELSRLLPEVRERYPNLAQPLAVSEAEARTRLLDAIVHALEALAQRRPIVFFIDDAQWADALTLDLLRVVLRNAADRSAPKMVLLTLRDDADKSMWLADLSRVSSITRLKLTPLTAADTQQWLAALTTDDAAPDLARFADWLFTETNGQPLFITETIKALIERGLLSAQRDETGRWSIDLSFAASDPHALRDFIPEGVRDVVHARVARLSAPGFALLCAGAVLSRGLSFDRMCVIAELRDSVGLTALDELLAARLLIETSAVDRPYEFTHDKIREVVYAEAGSARRRVFHRRAFESLRQARAPAAEVAHHARQAGLLTEAAPYDGLAGDEALRLYAVHDAIDHYKRALNDIPESSDERGQLYLKLGRAYELPGDWPNAHTTYEALIELAQRTHQASLECVALNRLATLSAWNAGDLPEAKRRLQQALDVAERHADQRGQAETEWNLAQIGVYAFEIEAADQAERALAAARTLTDPELLGRCWNVLAHAQSSRGQWAESLSTAREAWQQFVTLNKREMQVDCLCLVATAELNLGRLFAALTTINEALVIAIQIENAWGQTFSRFVLAQALIDQGELHAGLLTVETALASARSLGFPTLIIITSMVAGLARGLLGDASASREHLHETLQLTQALPNPRPYTEIIYSAQCVLAAVEGDWTQAGELAQQASVARDDRFMNTATLSREIQIEALGYMGALDLAEAEVARFATRVGDNPRLQLSLWRMQAALSKVHGETDTASLRLQEAFALAEELQLPLEQLSIATELVHQPRIDVAMWRDRAEKIRHSVAAKIADPQLQTSFLAAHAID